MENIHIVYISIFLILLMICFVCKFLTYDPVHTEFSQTAIIRSYMHQDLLLDGFTVNAEDFKICDARDITNDLLWSKTLPRAKVSCCYIEYNEYHR